MWLKGHLPCQFNLYFINVSMKLQLQKKERDREKETRRKRERKKENRRVHTDRKPCEGIRRWPCTRREASKCNQSCQNLDLGL